MESTNTREALANLMALQTAQAEGMDNIGIYVEKAYGYKMSDKEVEKAKSLNTTKGTIEMFLYIVTLHDKATIQNICKHASLVDMLDCSVLRHEGLSLDNSAKRVDEYLATLDDVEPFTMPTIDFTYEEIKDTYDFEKLLLKKDYSIDGKLEPKEFLELGVGYLKEHLTKELNYSTEEVSVIDNNIGLYFADIISAKIAYTEVIKTLEGNRND